MTATLAATPQMLVDHLETFGSAHRIASFFEAEGIKGRVGSSSSCPVANYTKSHIQQTRWVSAGPIGIGVGMPDGSSPWGSLSDFSPLQDFMLGFDRQEYPQLIDRSVSSSEPEPVDEY